MAAEKVGQLHFRNRLSGKWREVLQSDIDLLEREMMSGRLCTLLSRILGAYPSMRKEGRGLELLCLPSA